MHLPLKDRRKTEFEIWKKKARHKVCGSDRAREVQSESLLFSRYESQSKAERELYLSLRESVPVIDAAINKIVRLIGNFRIETSGSSSQKLADEFVKNVKTNGSSGGMMNFVYCYLDSLLTYGAAVGEMVPDAGANGIAALYNASLDDVEIRADKTPLDLVVCKNDMGQIARLNIKIWCLQLCSIQSRVRCTEHRF